MKRLGQTLVSVALLTAVPAVAGAPLNLVPLVPIEQNVGDEAGVQSIALADLDGDSLLDLVVIDIDLEEIVAFTGQGDGTFTDRRLIGFGDLPTAVVVADVTSPFATGGDIDGNLDVIVVDEIGGLQIFIGRGDGTFDPPDQSFDDLDTVEISAVAVADFDGDGRDDLAVLEAFDGVYFLCNAAGTMEPCPTPVVFLDEFSFELSGIAVGDYDGGGLDVAVIDSDTGELYVIGGNGDGTFDEIVEPIEIGPIGIEPRAVRAMPPSEDEENDAVVVLYDDPFADPPASVLSVFSSAQGMGEFARSDFPAGEVGNAVVIDDFDGDGRRDALVVGADEFDETAASTFLRGAGTGFAAPVSVASEEFPGGRALEGADLNDDGKVDLVAVTPDGTEVLVLLNDSVPPPPCAGDCDGNGVVGINELIRGVNIALGRADVSTCTAVDGDGGGTVAINELIAAVNNALDGCAA